MLRKNEFCKVINNFKRMDRVAQINQMLALSPKDVFLNYALAMEHISAENHQDAVNQLELVKSLQADYLPLYYQLAKSYEKLEDNDNAITTYEQGMLVAEQAKDRKTLAELRSALEELTF